MKKYIFIIVLVCIAKPSFAQSGFDKSLAEISFDLTYKLNLKKKKKVVVLFIKDINKATTVAGKYLADVISVNIVNDTTDFQVFDRENLSGIVEANKLIAEGYIDVDKAKELGKLLSVEAIIIGNYTVLSNTIKLTLKALDSNSGFVIAASMKDLPIDGDAAAILGININESNNADNRGFNKPINSNEQINNPETVNKECATNNTGDYCFENSTKTEMTIYIGQVGSSWSSQDMSLNPGQTQCFYNLKAGNYKYADRSFHFIPTIKGQILVEKCKSKTFVIK